ncbi:PadR family transcriptional regulator [Terracidiphilus gabretensis]|uniref:PadR family transcriptional regulator n=1 Tax=Terracidiphilus gabretensis TaxID=1577687 RepID=UPI0018D26E6E|nr:helix-turn-helix transcriptional regulator [Terracidiphilus gabretensis]
MLSLLRQSPMHPYLMRRLLRERHTDEVLELKPGSLYHAIGRLERANLIAAETRGREGKRPERTVYRITPAGEERLLEMLRQILAVPRHEASEFMAAMSFLVHVAPKEARALLEARCGVLKREIDERESAVALVRDRVARIHLVESEYLLAVQRAELDWTRELAKQIETGELNWDVEEILREAAREASEGPKE